MRDKTSIAPWLDELTGWRVLELGCGDDVSGVTKARLGAFDVVLWLGAFNQQRHPLLALERICEVTREFAIIEAQVTGTAPQPLLEFYECDATGNGWGPNVECLARMLRSAGFARVELLSQTGTRATFKAHRHWPDYPISAVPTLRLHGITNAVTGQPVFPRTGRRAFLAVLVGGLPAHAQRWDTRVEIGGFGIHPIYVGSPDAAGLRQINAPMPPGLELGLARVRVWHEGQRAAEVEIEVSEGLQW